MVSKAPDRTDWVKSQNSLSYLELFYSVDRVQLNVHSAQDSSHKENPCPAELGGPCRAAGDLIGGRLVDVCAHLCLEMPVVLGLTFLCSEDLSA